MTVIELINLLPNNARACVQRIGMEALEVEKMRLDGELTEVQYGYYQEVAQRLVEGSVARAVLREDM